METIDPKIKIRRGRPTNYKMSEASKDKTSKSRTGQTHPAKIKQKISDGVNKKHETGAPIEVIINTDLDKCGKFKDSSGYITICIPNPIVGGKTYNQKYHVALMEKRLGRKFKRGEQIHHWKEKDNNDIKTIALCRNKTEHRILDRAKAIIDREADTKN